MKARKLSFGEFVLDVPQARLWRGSQCVALAQKPFDVLCCLVDHPGQLLTKDDLLDAVWKNLHVSESSLTFSMNAIRVALGDDAKAPRYIETVKRRGYRFVAPVAPVAPPRPEPVLRPNHAQNGPFDERAGWRVGRNGSLETFDTAAQLALSGHRQVVFVTGEAGIGKSTFVEMAMERMRQHDVVVLRGCCVELFGTDEAFLPLIEALQDLSRGVNGLTILALLREYAPTWLAQMPALLDVTDRAAFHNEIFGATRERMLRELCDFLEVLSDELPVIAILEDLHWSDRGTLDVLSLLARRSRTAAILVLATYRSNEPALQAQSVRTISQDLQMRRCGIEIALEPLSRTDVEHYMMLRFGASQTAQALAERAFSRTRGQPLFMVSLVDYAFSGTRLKPDDGMPTGPDDAVISFESIIPRDLRDMITFQIDRLSEEEQRLVERASAAGAEFSAAMMAGLLGREVEDVEQACESLARRGRVLVSTGSAEWPDGTISGRYAFQHALYQGVLYERLGPAQRVRTHQHFAELLEQGYRDHLTEIASVLALHFEESRRFLKAVLYLNLAAVNSGKRFSTREAERYLTRALTLVDRLPPEDQKAARTKILKRRGWIRRVIGDLSGSKDDLYAMVASAEEAGHLKSEVTALMDLSRFCHYTDRPKCLEISGNAVARSQGLEDELLKAVARGNNANLQMVLKGWRADHAKVCYDTIRLLGSSKDPHEAMRCSQIETTIKYLSSDYAGSVAAASRGTELARIIGDGYIFVLYNAVAAFARLHMGAWREMRSGLASALAMAERNASRQAELICYITEGWLHAEALDLQGARDRCDRARDAAAEVDPFNYFIGQNLLLKACVGLGDLEAAGVCLEEIRRKVEVEGIDMESYIQPHFYYNASEYWFGRGDLDRARDQADALHACSMQAPEQTYLSLAHRLRSKIALAKGDVQEAFVQISQALAIIETRTLPLAAWRVYATAAAVQAKIGDAKKAGVFRNRSKAVIDSLAETLAFEDPLRSSLLTAYAVAH